MTAFKPLAADGLLSNMKQWSVTGDGMGLPELRTEKMTGKQLCCDRHRLCISREVFGSAIPGARSWDREAQSIQRIRSTVDEWIRPMILWFNLSLEIVNSRSMRRFRQNHALFPDGPSTIYKISGSPPTVVKVGFLLT